MGNTFRRTALVLALLGGTAQHSQAQPQPRLAAPTEPNTSATVFHGTPGEVRSAAEFPGYGSSAPPGFTSSAGGTTVFHGTPAGAAPHWPAPPPPWALSPPAIGSGR